MPMLRRKNPIYKLRKALAVLISRKLTLEQKLLLFKRNKKYKLYRHYNYAYIGEYQFSPSNSPLISHHHHHHHHHSGFSKKRRSRILHLLCGGAGMGSMIETNLDFGEFEPSAVGPLMNKENEDSRVIEELEMNGEEEDDDLSVDGRAQRFIERFYEKIRLERQQSFLQRSC
ncbi:Cotton fiber expressed protein [Carex littledalei]|uniref:Cotton fiber expressed protein n=1 Tax=Carex littledalei TaxID=544730 RepID=A0A833VJG6_9POAL|nr:Cotton fiber expressed protein [Carex littledalei]